MQITKYVHHGKDISHDVHYIADGKHCRYGSNEEPKERLRKAYSEAVEMVADMTGLYPQVERLTWSSNKENETTVKIEFIAFAEAGTRMKAEIKAGYRQVHAEDPVTKELEERWIPSEGIQEHHMQTIFELERSLAEYVRDGAGQMEFDFEVEKQEELLDQSAGHARKIVQMQK